MSRPVPVQGSLFDVAPELTAVLSAYSDHGTGDSGALSNTQLYEALKQAGNDFADQAVHQPVGRAQQSHNLLKRKFRWYQQTLKSLGLLERDEARRGVWQLTTKAREKLTPAPGSAVMLGFSTDLGLALWCASSSVFATLDEPITLCLTSPPYPLAAPRAYGNPTVAQYTDFVCELLEPIVKHLLPGGSVCLNISNDIFEAQSPARSTYRERLVIALEDRLGLHKMDELIWENPSKPPGPLQWASLSRQQLNTAWEPVYWFTNDPRLCRSDNRRVLQAHTEQHLKLLRQGGEKRSAVFSDGAYRVREGSFGAPTPGKIPRNILRFSHVERAKRETVRQAKAQGLPVHGATMPQALARFLVEFLTREGDLVVDPCGGWSTTGAAAQECGRRWLTTELMGEYVLGAANAFAQAPGFEQHGFAPPGHFSRSASS